MYSIKAMQKSILYNKILNVGYELFYIDCLKCNIACHKKYFVSYTNFINRLNILRSDEYLH